jgi:AbrB family looped-hinge helix DNA binding protein
MMQLNISKKGEIVIPKKIREHLGLMHAKTVVIELKGDIVQIRPRANSEDIIARWEERAKRMNIDVSKWTMGNDLYEEEFGKKWSHVSRR